MSFSFDGANAAGVRPAHVEPGAPGNWLRDERRPGANDGSRLTASPVNEVAANLRGLVTGAGLALLAGNHADADTMALRAVAALTTARAVAALPGENLLINPTLAINQRLFAGGALAAGVYGFDRWKGGSAGGDVTVATVSNLTTVTLNSGRITQHIEGALWGNLAGRVMTFSVEDLTGGTLDVIVNAVVYSITAGAGRRGVSFTLPVDFTANWQLQLRPAAGAVTFARAKLELGALATPWSPRPVTIELELCRRYFWKTWAPGTAIGTATINGAIRHLDRVSTTTRKQMLRRQFTTTMRAAPTITWYSSISGTAGVVYGGVEGDCAVASTEGTSPSTTGFPVLAVGVGIAGRSWQAHATADAEI